MSSLAGSVAIVTGASSGIGRASALMLAAQGASVVAVARRADLLEALCEEIWVAGGDAVALDADLGSRAAAEGVVARTVQARGRVDVLINAAGVMLNGPTLDSPADDWDQMVSVNLTGLMHLTKAALPHLVDAVGSGPRRVADVVNVSSIAGRFANAHVAAYNATKFGVTAFSESLRQEFSSRSVRVSVVEPGVVETELFGHQSSATQEHYEQLFGRVEKLLPTDVAAVIQHIVTAPRRVALCEVVVRPTDQR